jgi:hypothetical protein
MRKTFSVTELNKRNTDYQLEPVFRIPNTEQIIVPAYTTNWTTGKLKDALWYGLGNATWTTEQLLNSRAKPEFKCMWAREWTERLIFQGKPRTITGNEIEILMRARC